MAPTASHFMDGFFLDISSLDSDGFSFGRCWENRKKIVWQAPPKRTKIGICNSIFDVSFEQLPPNHRLSRVTYRLEVPVRVWGALLVCLHTKDMGLGCGFSASQHFSEVLDFYAGETPVRNAGCLFSREPQKLPFLGFKSWLHKNPTGFFQRHSGHGEPKKVPGSEVP